MRYNNTRRLERYSNGKEPHWKCGVPQGIVRSSRILSAKSIRKSGCFFLFSVTHGINFHGKRRLQVYEFFYGFLAFQQLMYYNKKIDTADGHKPETPL